MILVFYSGDVKSQTGKSFEIQVTAYKTTMLANG